MVSFMNGMGRSGTASDSPDRKVLAVVRKDPKAIQAIRLPSMISPKLNSIHSKVKKVLILFTTTSLLLNSKI